jgi:arginyl-tRNA synthetase
MKSQIFLALEKAIKLPKKEIQNLLEIPPNQELGDYAFPCFILAKKLKKNPAEIAKELSEKIKSKSFSVKPTGPYINFKFNEKEFSSKVLKEILKNKENYGKQNLGKGKTIVLDMSSPNIAKPFGIGHLRSTIIGNSISEIAKFQNYKPTKINYLGDWGTPFGKIIAGWKKYGSEKKFEKDPVKHLYEIYVKVSKLKEFEDLGKQEFQKLESGDSENIKLWKKFRSESIKEFKKIYKLLNVEFDVYSGESEYNNALNSTVKLLEKKSLLKESEGATIVNLEKYGLGVVLIKKSDGSTLYATRDIAAALERKKKYKSNFLVYEVGNEQSLYFKQLFKVLELLDKDFKNSTFHISHGLYLDKDGKKLATRKGKTIFMEDILEETISIALKKLATPNKKKAEIIARAAIVYGDLKNHRTNDMVFDTSRFLDFEGNTGPYLLYSYARAKSILKKAKSSKLPTNFEINEKEKALISELSKFPETAEQAFKSFSPNIIANYSYSLAQKFNEFYHDSKVLDSENESFRLNLVLAFTIVLKSSLSLLGLSVLDEM